VDRHKQYEMTQSGLLGYHRIPEMLGEPRFSPQRSLLMLSILTDSHRQPER